MSELIGLSLLFLVVSCSSYTYRPPKLSDEKLPQTLFKEFNPASNYKLIIQAKYPGTKGLTKQEAKQIRKDFLKNFTMDTMKFIYTLPQNVTYDNKPDGGTLMGCQSIKTEDSDIICTETANSSFSIFIPLEAYKAEVKKETGKEPNFFISYGDPQELAKYEKYANFHEIRENNGLRLTSPSDINFLVDSSSSNEAHLTYHEYSGDDEGKGRSINPRNFRTDFFNEIFFEKENGPWLLQMVKRQQYIAYKPKNLAPIINGNQDLDKFVDTHSFPEMSNEEFEGFYTRVADLISNFYLGNDDEKDGDDGVPKNLLSKSFLFFGDWNYTDGLNSLSSIEFEKFLKDRNERSRMFGLALLSYSKLTPQRTSKEDIILNIEIDLAKMFNEIKFIKIDDHIEK